MSINKVILIGNVGKDPEVRYVSDENQVAKLSLATSESYKNKSGEKVTDTEWHTIIVWRGLAKVVEKWVKKGDQVCIEGKITYKKWQDKEGNDRYSTEIVASNMTMLGGKKESQLDSNMNQKNTENIDDDFPF